MPALLSGSAIDYYGDTGGVAVDESAPVGPGFLAEVVRGLGGGDAAPPATPAPGSCCCAPGWCSRRRAACSARCAAVPVRAGRPARLRARSTCRGSRWTTRSARSAFLLEHDAVGRPGQPRRAHSRSRTPSSPARWPRRSAGPAPFAVPAFALTTVPGRWPRRCCSTASGRCRRSCEAAGYRFRHPTLARGAGRGGRPGLTCGHSHDVVVVGAGLAGLRAAQAALRGAASTWWCWRPRTGRAGGWPPTSSTASAATAASRCSTPPTRRCGPRPTSTRLDLRAFEPGAAVRGADGRLHVLRRPARGGPALLPRTAVGPAAPAARQGHAGGVDGAGAGRAGPHRVAAQVDRSAAAGPRRGRAGGPVARPGAAAVPVRGARRGRADARRRRSSGWSGAAFALGTIAVPDAGMGALPAQLAAGLPDGVLRLGRRVEPVPRRAPCAPTASELAARAVRGGDRPGDRGRAAARTGGARHARADHLYHVAPDPPASLPTLHLDGTGGPLANTVVLTEAAPGYSPDGRALVSSSFLGTADRVPEPTVRRELARIYGVPTDDWVHLHTAEIPRALPALPAGQPAAPRRRAGRRALRGRRPPRHPVHAGRPGQRPPRRRGRLAHLT